MQVNTTKLFFGILNEVKKNKTVNDIENKIASVFERTKTQIPSLKFVNTILRSIRGIIGPDKQKLENITNILFENLILFNQKFSDLKTEEQLWIAKQNAEYLDLIQIKILNQGDYSFLPHLHGDYSFLPHLNDWMTGEERLNFYRELIENQGEEAVHALSHQFDELILSETEANHLKQMIYTSSIHTSSIPTLLISLIRDRNLPPLSEKDREATGGNGPFYSKWFKENAKNYHEKGLTWSNDKLQRFFEEGLLNHYINTNLQEIFHEFGDFARDYNYQGWLTPEYENCKFQAYDREQFQKIAHILNLSIGNLKDKELIQLIQPYVALLKDLVAKYSNPQNFPLKLRHLGALFQRQKVEAEKLRNKMREENIDNEKLLQELLKKDQEMELIQQTIYQWTRECIQQLRDHIKHTPIDQLSLDNFSFKDPDFLPFLLKKDDYSLIF